MVSNYEDWRSARHAELNSADSWLGLVGLHWLETGGNRVGSADDCRVRLPGGPAFLGELRWDGTKLLWQPLGGEVSPLASDRDGAPTVVVYENWSFFPVDRDGRIAIRVRDRAWAAGRPAADVDCFPYDPAWSLDADWQPLLPSRVMTVPNVAGELKTVVVTHRAVFKVGGVELELLPMSVGEQAVFFVFRDRTSGRETYGAGRFLEVPLPVAGRLRLDFNFAFNPPCAFTPFATCPLPPPENWLPLAVPVGEMKWQGR